MLNNERALLGHLAASMRHGRSCLQLPVTGGASGTVCLLPCLRWNYCHDDQSCCTSPLRLPLALTSRARLERAGTAVLHQVGPGPALRFVLRRATLLSASGDFLISFCSPCSVGTSQIYLLGMHLL